MAFSDQLKLQPHQRARILPCVQRASMDKARPAQAPSRTESFHVTSGPASPNSLPTYLRFVWAEVQAETRNETLLHLHNPAWMMHFYQVMLASIISCVQLQHSQCRSHQIK